MGLEKFLRIQKPVVVLGFRAFGFQGFPLGLRFRVKGLGFWGLGLGVLGFRV